MSFHDLLAVQRSGDRSPDADGATAYRARGERTNLSPQLRARMETRFGADFSGVRVHTDASAGAKALGIGARAFTRGRDIYFAPGHYQPHTPAGQGLLAHELTHVVQQRAGAFPVANASRAARGRHALEQEAERAERSVRRSSPVAVRGQADPGAVQRSPLETLLEMRRIVSGGIEAAASYVIETFAAADPLIAQVAAIRRRLAGMTEIRLEPSVVARLEAMYHEARAAAPSWLPVPDLSFRGAPVQAAGVLAIPAVPVLLLLAILILLWWIATNANPQIRRSRERALEEFIRYLRGPWPIPGDPAPPVEPPAPAPETAPAPRPTPAPRPAPGPRPGPKPGNDPPPVPMCPFPTGLTPADPIPMTWFKPEVDDYYPPEITVAGRIYHHDQPDSLPFGEPIGVPRPYWPRPGKIFQLVPEVRGPNADRFRAVLTRHGFDWTGLQADHVQDLQWEGPDAFENIWPMSSSANLSAGPRQNNFQRVSYCETPAGPPRINVTLQQMKAAGQFGRWFTIASVQR